jgi:hypothetical protein
MRNFMSFVNEQLRWEEESPHCHDCHDPPHTAGTGFLDDRSPPRRLPWVVGSGLSASSTGEDWLYPKSLHRHAFNSKGAWLSKVFGIV